MQKKSYSSEWLESVVTRTLVIHQREKTSEPILYAADGKPFELYSRIGFTSNGWQPKREKK